MGAKKKAAQAGAAAYAARNNPYVQRVVDDEELRANLWQAYESARAAAGRLSNGKPTSTQIFDDKKLQKDIREAAENLRDVGVALREAPKRSKPKKRGFRSERCWWSASSAPGWPWRSARACARRCSTRCSAPRRSSSTRR